MKLLVPLFAVFVLAVAHPSWHPSHPRPFHPRPRPSPFIPYSPPSHLFKRNNENLAPNTDTDSTEGGLSKRHTIGAHISHDFGNGLSTLGRGGGTSYSARPQYRFKRRLDNLEQEVGGLSKRGTFGAHLNNGPGGPSVGAHISHDFGNGFSAEGKVNHHLRGGGTTYSAGLTYRYKRRLDNLEQEVGELHKRLVVDGDFAHDKHGTSFKGTTSHDFNNGLKVHGHVNHHPMGGTGYGGGFSYDFGRREIEAQ